MDESINSKVTFDNFSKTLVKRRAKVLIHLRSYEDKFISKMNYIPNMKINILV